MSLLRRLHRLPQERFPPPLPYGAQTWKVIVCCLAPLPRKQELGLAGRLFSHC